MGSFTSRTKNVSNCTELMLFKKLTKPQLFAILGKGNKQDYYEFFGFARYNDYPPEEVRKRWKSLARLWHPDKFEGNDKEERDGRNAIFVALADAKETFLDPAKKRRYDEHLKAARGDYTWAEWFWMKSRTFGSMLLTVAGLVGTVVGGPVGAIAGGAMMGAGVHLYRSDPETPLRDLATGTFFAGAAGGAIGALSVAAHTVALTYAAPAVVGCGAAAGVVKVVGHGAHLALEWASPPKILFRWSDPLTAKPRRTELYLSLFHPEIVGSEPLKIGQEVLEDLAVVVKDKVEYPTDANRELIEKLGEYTQFESRLCIRAYTLQTRLYGRMNDYLDKNNPDLCLYAGFVHNFRQEFKDLMGKTGKYTGTLWRGAYVEDIRAFTTKGARLLVPKFMSASTNKGVAERYAQSKGKNALIEIDCTSNNTPARGVTYAVDVSSLSGYPGEAEVLFYPYSGFEVKAATWSQQKKIWEIQLEVLDTLKVEDNPNVPGSTQLCPAVGLEGAHR